MRTAVVLVIYRRPWLVSQQMGPLRAARWPLVLVAADAPKSPDEQESCRQARDGVRSALDWGAEQHLHFTETHMGLSRRIITAIDLAFDVADQVIVLEDDCLIDGGFLPYAEEMLDRFRADQQVWMIAGGRAPGPAPNGEASYTFSWYPFIWGWATWRDRWATANLGRDRWDVDDGERILAAAFDAGAERDYWTTKVTKAIRGHDAWDYLWFLEMRRHGGLCAVPRWNMVQNVGFDHAATHTKVSTYSEQRSIVLEGPTFPLKHCRRVERDPSSDRVALQSVFMRDWIAGMP